VHWTRDTPQPDFQDCDAKVEYLLDKKNISSVLPFMLRREEKHSGSSVLSNVVLTTNQIIAEKTLSF